jgi:transposase
MTARAPRRRHSAEFRQRVCQEIRSGLIGRREAQRTYRLSDNLIHAWLARSDSDAGTPLGAASSRLAVLATPATYEDQIAVLERKVAQLTMALERPSRHDSE